MRYQLISHYQIADLVENQKPKNEKQRKILAARISDAIHDISDYDRSKVLSCYELQNINLGNALRRASMRYGVKG